MTDQTPPPVPANPEPGLPALAAAWARRIMPTALVPFSRAQGRAELLRLLGSLAEAVRAEPFTPQPAREAARRMVECHFVHPEVAGHSVELLLSELLPAAGIAETAQARRRVVELAGTFAADFTAALKDDLLRQQEDMKAATHGANVRLKQEREEISATMETMFSTSAIGIGIGNLDGSVERVNPKLAEILGYQPDELRGRAIYELIGKSAQKRILDKYRRLCQGELDKFVDESQWITSDDEPVWIQVTVTLVRNADGTPAYPVAMLDNTSDAHLLRDQLNNQSVYDELTRLSRFPAFRSHVRDKLAEAGPGDRLALCFFDLDGFKVVNDGAGRDAGDRVLQKVGRILSEVFAPVNGTVARVTGDGFAVLIVRPPALNNVNMLVEDALEQIREPLWLSTDPGAMGVACSASVGIVDSPASGMGADELIRAGEITTHRAKLAGKNQWIGFDRAENHRHYDRFRLGAAIPGALENGEFVTRYHPIVRFADGALAGVRSYVLWLHDERGPLTPPDFLDLAEEIGFAPELAKWALGDVCRQAASWRAELGEAAPVVELEFSERTAKQPDLIDRVLKELAEYELPATALRLVFPLASLADDASTAPDSAWGLHDNGVGIVVSHVGGGALDLVGEPDLPLDGLALHSRIPKLLAGSEASPVERSLADMVKLAGERELPVTACDVDVVDVAQRMRHLGIDLAYGAGVATSGTPEDIRHHLAAAVPEPS